MTGRSHGPLAVSWWSATAPTTGPTGTTTTWVANVLKFTQPGRVAGFRFFDGTNAASYATIALLIDDSFAPGKYVATKTIYMPPGVTAKWNQMWFRPWVRVNTAHTYWVAVLYVNGGLFRNNNALSAGPVTRNGIQMINGFQSTLIDLTNASPTLNTNANAVGVLFYPD